jgi:carbamoyltransferase
VETAQFKELIEKELIHIYSDGSIWLNQYYFQYATGFRMVHEKRWEKLFGIKRREPEAELLQVYCNLALAIQQVTEEIVLKMAAEAKRLTGATVCCLAGGVALNCVANGKLHRAGIFEDIYIQPAAGDAGGALGAALTIYYQYFGQERIQSNESDRLEGSYLGPSYSNKEVELVAKRVKGVYHYHANNQALYEQVSGMLANGKVVGWYQGRMEFGPRALGNRSILGDPRDPEMQKKLNLKIKYREGFRPFAPAVLAEDAAHFFELEGKSPYMLLVAPLREVHRKVLPENFQQLSLWERLYYSRSKLQAITHLDFSARVQTVHPSTNPRFYDLLQSFKSKTGVGVLVNTSFNVRGEPIVCTPADAYRCFMSTDMDVLVLNNYLFFKEEQPDYTNKEKWMINFAKD